MESIFDWKNSRNELHLSVVKELEVLSLGLRSLLMVEKRTFWLLGPA